ncbi:hypothetical protein AAHE18_08G157000 [Arachis hypogaea]
MLHIQVQTLAKLKSPKNNYYLTYQSSLISRISVLSDTTSFSILNFQSKLIIPAQDNPNIFSSQDRLFSLFPYIVFPFVVSRTCFRELQISFQIRHSNNPISIIAKKKKATKSHCTKCGQLHSILS